MLFGERGQAFSTFQLLIAAIVAIIILTFLLGILGFIPSIGATNDPVQTAADTVKRAMQSPGQHFKSSPVLFKAGQYITSRDIASQAKVGVSPEQLCLLLDKELKASSGTSEDAWDNQQDTTDGGSYVQNKRNIDVQLPLSVVCDNADRITDTINKRYSGDSPVGLDEVADDLVSVCSVDTTGKQKICAIVVRAS